jgi:hydrogenase/urease accessory protein HupE
MDTGRNRRGKKVKLRGSADLPDVEVKIIATLLFGLFLALSCVLSRMILR